ncbi:RNA-binding protein [Rothia sp. HMSC065G12]|uniref:RNA-binding protein n=1 Tax=Rothia sp. HMSC065G12 TaxID=1739308 RepID=UPI0008A4FE5C|nr:RNA-binding protein [Rothia sp. HMSC065G12]OFK70864.1 RNA-binding protein [Rothia sp. HMSC065G12]
MGLNYPVDLEAWHAWQQRQNTLRWVKGRAQNMVRARRGAQQGMVSGVLYTRGAIPRVLIVLDSFSPTSRNALLEPLKHLEGVGVALWCPSDASAYLNGQYASTRYSRKDWNAAPIRADELAEKLPGVRLVLSLGHYLPRGHAAYRFARERGIAYWVVQHGLLVPHAPPLPIGSTLLAFSDEDAQFWTSRRRDVQTHTVGSQLLYRAIKNTHGETTKSLGKILFLGQMHGAELPRASFARAAHSFLKRHDGIYRPHPSETDKLSRATHALWEIEGIAIDRSSTPLNEVPNPVVSVFSTGVLEAAIRGIPAWVYHPNPPAWLEEFWARYGMNRWGEDPTPAPEQPAVEPAHTIAQLIIDYLEAY